MKITPLTIDFDVTNAQEVEFVNDLLDRLFGRAPFKATAVPTENTVNSTSVPTFSEPTQTAAPVHEVEAEDTAVAIAEETIADAVAEARKTIGKPVTVGKPVKPKTVKEASRPTIEPEPIQAPLDAEEAPEKASNKPLTEKDMQEYMLDLMRTGKVTRPQLTDIMLELGGASLMRIKPEQYELLKQRIEAFIEQKE